MGSQRKICCPYCPKKSFRADNWKRHMNSFHPNMLTVHGQAFPTQSIPYDNNMAAPSDARPSGTDKQSAVESDNLQYEQQPDPKTLMTSLEKTTQINLSPKVQKNNPDNLANSSSDKAPEPSAECLELDVENFDERPSNKILEHLRDCPQCWPRLRRGLGPLNGIGQCLLAAVQHTKSALVQYLIKFDRILHYKDEQGWVAVHHAVTNVIDGDIVTLLCREGSSTNLSNRDGETPLALACKRCTEDVTVADFKALCAAIKTLIDAGADPNIPDHAEELPIHLLLRISKPQIDQKETYDAFVECIELVASKTKNLDATDRHNYTPLEGSIRLDVVAPFEILLRHGADPSLIEERLGVFLGQVQSVAMAKSVMGALPDVIACSHGDLYYALDHYIRNARDDLVDFLIRRSTQLMFGPSVYGRLLLDKTFQGNFTDSASMFRIREALLKAGCNPHVKTKVGVTTLHLWAQEHQYLFPKYLQLINEGSKLTYDTILLSAIEMRLRTAELLTRHQADMNAVNNEGETPLGILIGFLVKVCQTWKLFPGDEQSFDDASSMISSYPFLINGIRKLGARLLPSEKSKHLAAMSAPVGVFDMFSGPTLCTIASCKVIETESASET